MATGRWRRPPVVAARCTVPRRRYPAIRYAVTTFSRRHCLSVDDGSGDVFVHQTRIHKDGFRSLAEGESLEFKGEPTLTNPLLPSNRVPASRSTEPHRVSETAGHVVVTLKTTWRLLDTHA